MAIEGELKTFSWDVTLKDAAEALRVDEEDMDAFADVFARAKQAFVPRVWMREVTVEAIGDDFALVSGEWFAGERVASLLKDATRIWALVGTAGEKPAFDASDVLESWWVQTLGEDAVHEAMAKFTASMPCPEGEHLSTISPGSLPDWPITEQQPLFRLLGETNAGVRLTETCLMLPRCSVSGFMFSAAKPFCQCAHCDRRNCPNRRAEGVSSEIPV